jgi:hypothetical protein
VWDSHLSTRGILGGAGTIKPRAQMAAPSHNGKRRDTQDKACWTIEMRSAFHRAPMPARASACNGRKGNRHAMNGGCQ